MVAALAMLVRHRWSSGMALHFVLPAAALASMMLVAEWRQPRGNVPARAAGVLRTWLPFMAGVMLPVGAFALGYALRGQFGELLYGVFVLPSRRVQFAAIRPPGPASLLAALPLLALVVPWPRLGRGRLAINVALLAAGLLAMLVVSATSAWLYGRTWLSVRSLAPVAVIAGRSCSCGAGPRSPAMPRGASASAGALDHRADRACCNSLSPHPSTTVTSHHSSCSRSSPFAR